MELGTQFSAYLRFEFKADSRYPAAHGPFKECGGYEPEF